MVGEDFDDSLS